MPNMQQGYEEPELDMKAVLQHRNKFSQGMKIFYLEECDSNGKILKNYLKELIKLSLPNHETPCGSLPYRLGILYEFINGHFTPLLIEFNIQVAHKNTDIITLPPRFRIYSTDSRAFDVDSGESLRELILDLPNLHDSVEVYGLGLDPDKYEAKQNTIRQHGQGFCGLYSLLDLELMLRAPSLSMFFRPHIAMLTKEPHLEIKNNRTFQITSLPPNMMMYTQSINGNDDTHRKGLRHYIKDNPQDANICFTLADKAMSFADMICQEGYLSILKGLSQPRAFLEMIKDAVDNGQGNETFNVGEKKITLRALYKWHFNQEQKNSKQKAFMMDYFVAVFNELIATRSQIDDSTKDEANLLLKNGELLKFADHACQFGPDTELFFELPEIISQPNRVDPNKSNEELFDGIVTQFAREVILRTPHRAQLLTRDLQSPFVSTPSPKKVSPDEYEQTTPPCVIFRTHSTFFASSPLSSHSFRLPEQTRNQVSHSAAAVFCPVPERIGKQANNSVATTTSQVSKHDPKCSRRLNFLKYESSDSDFDYTSNQHIKAQKEEGTSLLIQPQ